MRTRRFTRTQSVLALAAGCLLAACAQTKRTPKTGEVSNMVVQGGTCKGALTLGKDDAQGLFTINIFKNRTTGKLEGVGKGFVATKPLGKINPYGVLGYTTRTKEEKTAYKGLKFKDLGGTIDISLGVNEARPGDLESNRSKVGQLVSAIRASDDTEAETSSLPTISFAQRADQPKGLYVASYDPPTDLGAIPSPAGQAATDASLGGVGQYRSLVVDAKTMGGIALSIPADVESPDHPYDLAANQPKANIGDDLKIAIAKKDPNASADSRLIIQVTERSKQPSWIATCVMPDAVAEDGTISVPTKWEGGEMKEGNVYITVMRSTLAEAGLSDSKNRVYFDVTSGIIIDGTLSAPADK